MHPTDTLQPAPRPAVVTVGDELVYAERENGNLTWILQALVRRGIPAVAALSLPDEADEIAAWVRWLVGRGHWPVLVAGGLGGTHDDCTRQGIAAGLGRPLRIHAECDALLAAHYGEHYTAQRRRMAELPADCALLANPHGAPGFACDGVYAFPGFPRMLQPMLDGVLSHLLPPDGTPPGIHEYALAVREGDIALAIEAFSHSHPSARIGIYPSNDAQHPAVIVRLRTRGDDPATVAAFAALVARLGG